MHEEIKMKNLRIEEMKGKIIELRKSSETFEKHRVFGKEVKEKNNSKKREIREVRRNQSRCKRIHIRDMRMDMLMFV